MNTKPTFKSGEIDIDTEIYEPTGKKNGGVIVIAHGSDGMRKPWEEMIQGYGEELAKLGFVATIPHYFRRTNTPDERGSRELATIPTRRDAWQAALADAVAHAKTLPGVDSSRVGLLGFSLGGHLCLRLRASAKVLVEFFAPEFLRFGGLFGSSGGVTLHAQIHHGKDDTAPETGFANAGSIKALLEKEGTPTELCEYDDAGHEFIGTTKGAPGLGGTDEGNAKASAEAKAKTLKFFADHL